jgi:hypothetical protein
VVCRQDREGISTEASRERNGDYTLDVQSSMYRNIVARAEGRVVRLPVVAGDACKRALDSWGKARGCLGVQGSVARRAGIKKENE